MQEQIICPKCKTPLTQALFSQIQEQVKAEFDEENKKQSQDLELKIKIFEQKERKASEELQKKELELKQRNKEIEESKKDFDGLVAKGVKEESEKIKIAAQKEALERTKRESAQELKLLNEQLASKDATIGEFTKQELALRKRSDALEEEKRLMELTKQRELDYAKKEIREKALSEAAEQTRLKDKEKDKIIDDLKKSLEDAQRKASQGSQQLQGEVQELALEEILRRAFPIDVIEPVGKGVKGADVKQIVKTQLGNICGVILWESKRAKAWSDDWLVKLKDNLRAEKANIPIIVSSIFPKGENSDLILKEGVWVCSFSLVLSLAEMVRQRLIEVAKEKYVSQNRTEKAELIYGYVTGHEFRQQVEATLEVYRDMSEQIVRERAVFEKNWKAREAQVQKLFLATGGIIGSMAGKIGSSMPMIKGLELLESGESDK